MDVYGTALLDYQNNNYTEDISTISSLGDIDTMPLHYLFRTFSKMPLIEQEALKKCRGNVLDIGCGAGSHSLYLQEKGFAVTALDHSSGAIKTCTLRGITNTVNANIFEYNGPKYDTLLMLMNGIGIAGYLNRLDVFFKTLKQLLEPGGQILLDSSDIIYTYDLDDDGGHWIPELGYYGELQFEMVYKKKKSDLFPWLFIDFNTLKRAANANNLSCELIIEGEHFDYLAQLQIEK